MAIPAGGTPAEILTGDTLYLAGGVGVDYLTGAFVKSVAADGSVVYQADDGTETTFTLTIGTSALTDEQIAQLDQILGVTEVAADLRVSSARTWAASSDANLAAFDTEPTVTQLEGAAYGPTITGPATTQDRWVILRVAPDEDSRDFRVVQTVGTLRYVVPGNLFRHVATDSGSSNDRYHQAEVGLIANATVSLEKADGASTHFRGEVGVDPTGWGRNLPDTGIANVQAAFDSLDSAVINDIEVVATASDLPAPSAETLHKAYLVQSERVLYIGVGDTHIVGHAVGTFSVIPQRNDISAGATLSPAANTPLGYFEWVYSNRTFYQVVDRHGVNRWTQTTPAIALADSRTTNTNDVISLGPRQTDAQALALIPDLPPDTDVFYVGDVDLLFYRLDLSTYSAGTLVTDHFQFLRINSDLEAQVTNIGSGTTILTSVRIDGTTYLLPNQGAWTVGGNYPTGVVTVNDGVFWIRNSGGSGDGGEPIPSNSANWTAIRESGYRGLHGNTRSYTTGEFVLDDNITRQVYLRVGGVTDNAFLSDQGWLHLTSRANPIAWNDQLTRLATVEIGGETYRLPEVQPNPSATPTAELDSMHIDGIDYSFDVRGHAVSLGDTLLTSTGALSQDLRNITLVGNVFEPGIHGASIHGVELRLGTPGDDHTFELVIARVTLSGSSFEWVEELYRSPVAERVTVPALTNPYQLRIDLLDPLDVVLTGNVDRVFIGIQNVDVGDAVRAYYQASATPDQTSGFSGITDWPFDMVYSGALTFHTGSLPVIGTTGTLEANRGYRMAIHYDQILPGESSNIHRGTFVDPNAPLEVGSTQLDSVQIGQHTFSIPGAAGFMSDWTMVGNAYSTSADVHPTGTWRELFRSEITLPSVGPFTIKALRDTSLVEVTFPNLAFFKVLVNDPIPQADAVSWEATLPRPTGSTAFPTDDNIYAPLRNHVVAGAGTNRGVLFGITDADELLWGMDPPPDARLTDLRVYSHSVGQALQSSGAGVFQVRAIRSLLPLIDNVRADFPTLVGYASIGHDEVAKNNVQSFTCMVQTGDSITEPITLSSDELNNIGFLASFQSWTWTGSNRVPCILYSGHNEFEDTFGWRVTPSNLYVREQVDQGAPLVALFFLESTDGLAINGMIAISWNVPGAQYINLLRTAHYWVTG